MWAKTKVEWKDLAPVFSRLFGFTFENFNRPPPPLSSVGHRRQRMAAVAAQLRTDGNNNGESAGHAQFRQSRCSRRGQRGAGHPAPAGPTGTSAGGSGSGTTVVRPGKGTGAHGPRTAAYERHRWAVGVTPAVVGTADDQLTADENNKPRTPPAPAAAAYIIIVIITVLLPIVVVLVSF